MKDLILTFDVEDFINDNAFTSLNNILLILDKYDLFAFFFITGHVAEKLANYPEIIDLLKQHEIGYHSTSHGVRPNIFEYTDILDYNHAKQVSIIRETSRIDPITGEILGKGGINTFKELFPHKTIRCFRAPYLCWSPPHIEALNKLGIKYDFSTYLDEGPVYHKGTIFYPKAKLHDLDVLNNKTTSKSIGKILLNLCRPTCYVLLFHPSIFVNKHPWDNFLFKMSQPTKPINSLPRTPTEATSILHRFDNLLKTIQLMAKTSALKILKEPERLANPASLSTHKISVLFDGATSKAITLFNYKTKYLWNHFLTYFDKRL